MKKWEQDLIENLHHVLKIKSWHKKLTNFSYDLQTKHMLTRRSDSLHLIASQLSMLKLLLVSHNFLLKRPIKLLIIENFDLLSPAADPENFGGGTGFTLGWMWITCKDVRHLDQEKGVNISSLQVSEFFSGGWQGTTFWHFFPAGLLRGKSRNKNSSKEVQGNAIPVILWKFRQRNSYFGAFCPVFKENSVKIFYP